MLRNLNAWHSYSTHGVHKRSWSNMMWLGSKQTTDQQLWAPFYVLLLSLLTFCSVKELKGGLFHLTCYTSGRVRQMGPSKAPPIRENRKSWCTFISRTGFESAIWVFEPFRSMRGVVRIVRGNAVLYKKQCKMLCVWCKDTCKPSSCLANNGVKRYLYRSFQWLY